MEKIKMNKPFCYNVSSAANTTLPINFAGDSDFKLQEIRCTGTAGVTINIQFSESDFLSSGPLATALFGEGQNGIKFFESPGYKILRGSKLNVTFAGITGGATEEVQLWGYKV